MGKNTAFNLQDPFYWGYYQYLLSIGRAPGGAQEYCRDVHTIVERENLNQSQFINQISNIVVKYDVGGIEEAFGKSRKSVYINSLKRFEEYVMKCNP